MPTSRRSNLIVLLSHAAVLTAGQQAGSPSQTTPPPTSNSIASSSSAVTTGDLALQLWSMASGLLSSYYPSAAPSEIATLTWPDTVVIGGTTYNMQSLSDATATPTSGSTPTSASTDQTAFSTSATPTQPAPTEGAAKGSDEPHRTGPIGDKRLGIIIGSVIGLVVLILLCIVFWCMKRRKDDTGSFFMRRRTPSIASSNIRSWLPSGRQDTYGTTTYVSAGKNNPDAWEKQQTQVTVRPQMAEPRMSQHPAFAPARLHGSSRSTSEDNPFYTPVERLDAQLGYNTDLERGPYDPHPVELNDDGHAQRRSSDSLRATGDRPPTPFSPMEMMGFGASRAAPPSQVERRDFGHTPAQGQASVMNPFSSPEDEENDLVSPILPTRSPERRHSPMVHYPSWDEVSEFDFNGDGRQRIQNMSSSETDGGDGWRPLRERMDGRYELA